MNERHTFGYDALGRRTLMADSTGRYTTAYDEQGRATEVHNPNSKTITYAYDCLGRRDYLIPLDPIVAPTRVLPGHL